MFYYCDHFEAVRTVVNSLDSNDAEAIVMAKTILANPQLPTQLSFIKTQFSAIVHAITKLETQGLELRESLESVEAVRNALKSMRDKKFVRKLDDVLQRNVGYQTLQEIRDVLYNGTQSEDRYIQKLSPAELTKFRFAPTTSCDAERTFSSYKHVFSDKRKNFTFENLKKHLIVNCNGGIVED